MSAEWNKDVPSSDEDVPLWDEDIASVEWTSGWTGVEWTIEFNEILIEKQCLYSRTYARAPRLVVRRFIAENTFQAPDESGNYRPACVSPKCR